MNESKDLFTGPVVVIGAKPNAVFPALAAPVVITANAAVELGVHYRERFGSRLVAVASSGDLLKRPDMQEALRKSRPEDLVLLGDHIGAPEQFVKHTLELGDTVVTVISFCELQRLIKEALGWRVLFLMVRCLWARGVKSFIKHDVPDLLTHRTYTWMSRSTGLNAILYALKRFPHAKEIVVAGVGLQAGGHSTGTLTFAEKTARVDRTTFSLWPRARRPRVYTTDEVMSKVGKVSLWEGETFHIT